MANVGQEHKGILYQLRKRYTATGGSLTYYGEFFDASVDDAGRPVRDGSGRRVRLAMRSLHTDNEREAWKRAKALIDDGSITNAKDDIETFFTRFWTPGESLYLAEKEATKGHTLSPAYCQHNRVWLETYFYPYCKKNGLRRLSDLGTMNLKQWVLWLYANRKQFNISGSTVNKVRQAVAVATRWAYMSDSLAVDPMARVLRVGDEAKPRKAFELEEVKALMAQEWPDPRTKTACLLAASGGLRLGECRGLLDDALHLDDGAPFLYVRTNWVDDGQGLRPPKSKDKNRQVPLRSGMAIALRQLLDAHPYDTSPRFVFWGESPEVPIAATAISADLKRAMKAAGITGKSFHSFRHFANSWMVPAVGDAMTRQIIGHAGYQVQESYTHALADTMDRIRTAAPAIVDESESVSDGKTT